MKEEQESFKRLYESANETIIKLQKEITKLENENMILKMKDTQWGVEKNLQSNIIQQTIENANFKNNQYLEQISELKEEIRALKTKVN